MTMDQFLPWNTQNSLNASLSSQSLLLQWLVCVWICYRHQPIWEKINFKSNRFYTFRFQMKATFHMIMNGDNTKAQSTTQQYLPDDAFFCPHPELCMVWTCQKAPQYLAPPLSTGTREGAHCISSQCGVQAKLLIPQFRHSLSIH